MTFKANDYLKEVGVPFACCNLQLAENRTDRTTSSSRQNIQITMIPKVKPYLLGSIKLCTKFWKQETIPKTNRLTDLTKALFQYTSFIRFLKLTCKSHVALPKDIYLIFNLLYQIHEIIFYNNMELLLSANSERVTIRNYITDLAELLPDYSDTAKHPTSRVGSRLYLQVTPWSLAPL